MAACRSTIDWNTPRLMRWRVSFEKKPSTALSQEPDFGVKWKVQRGMPDEPGFDLWMLMAGVVVDNGMNQLAGRNRALDGI